MMGSTQSCDDISILNAVANKQNKQQYNIPLGQDFLLILPLSQASLTHHLKLRMPFYKWDLEAIANDDHFTIELSMLMDRNDSTC